MPAITKEYIESLSAKYGALKVLDDVIQYRKLDKDQGPILAYPRGKSAADYEYFTAQELDRMIDGDVKRFQSFGLGPSDKRKTIGLLAPSNLDMVVAFFAISRLGHIIFTISPRLPPLAIASLLKETGCQNVVHGDTPQIQQAVSEAKKLLDFNAFLLPARQEYDVPLSDYYQSNYDRDALHTEGCLIIHSSGSTGLPKSITLPHRALLSHCLASAGEHNFNALPWYHLHGIGSSLQAMYFGKTAHMWNAALPITAEGLIEVLETAKPGALHTVPYVLGLMAESEKGIELLRQCKVVTAAGARTPDELGDRLVKSGVKFGSIFGMTEAGLLGDSVDRPEGDDAWDYIRVAKFILNYVHFDCMDEKNQLYEAIYLNGHPALCVSNTDYPVPGSWRSKDLFKPHPTIKNAWKYISRLDDRVTLVNGEKVLPLPIEGRIRMEPLVRDCAVVGVSKSVPGLLAFRAKQFDHLSNEEFLDALWPAIEDANSRAEAFSQITKNMVALIPSDVDYPHTDKNSIIRAQTYQKFENEIEALYKNEEESGEHANDEGKLELDLPGLENFLLSTIKKDLDLEVGLDSDLFAAGVDSLKAIQLRRLIIENIALHQQALPQNVIYNCGNVRNLAKHLHSLSKGEELGQAEGQDIEGMRKMIEKYSIEKQDRVVSKPNDDSQFSAVVTGATVAIGVHVLAQLVAREEVKKVYCFCRGQNAPERVKESLRIRKILTRKNFKEEYLEKIVAVEASPSKDNFGLDQETFSALKEDTGLIFHGAWPVNFNIPLGSFEEHIKGLNNLIRFSLQVNRPKPAQVFFCTSISTALGAPEGSLIPDAPVKELSYAAGTGYSQSKLVGEEIMFDAAKKGADTYNVRIGQVVGDTQEGVWNDSDSYPLIIRAATVMKVMPALNEVCEWLPVDTLAEAISQISINVVNHEDPPRMFNLVNPIRCHWDDVLKELAKSGLEFQVVPFQKWLEMLRESSAKGEVAINPAIKLIDYFEDLYGDGSVGVGGVQFEVKTAKQFSSAMKSPPDIIEQGLVGKFLSNWLPKWKEEESKVNKA